MSNSSNRDPSKINSTKLCARFTPAESRLLDLISTATGVSVSAYIRTSVKRNLLEDFLKQTGHQSTLRSPSDITAANISLDALLRNVDCTAADHPTD